MQNKACRYFLGVGENAANLATRGDMGWTDCLVNQRLETCRLFCKVTDIQNSRLVNGLNIMVNAGRKCFLRLFMELGYHVYLRKIQLKYVFNID